MDSFRTKVLDVVPRLRAYARALVRDSRIEADDLVQDAVVEMLSSRHNYTDGNFDGWAFTIQRRVFLKRVRTAIRFPERYDPARIENDAALPESLICGPHQMDSALLREVGRAIDALPSDKREVLYLLAVEGLGYAEIAEILGESESAVRSRIHHARRAIEHALGDRAQPGRLLGSLPGSSPNSVGTITGSAEPLAGGAAAAPPPEEDPDPAPFVAVG